MESWSRVKNGAGSFLAMKSWNFGVPNFAIGKFYEFSATLFFQIHIWGQKYSYLQLFLELPESSWSHWNITFIWKTPKRVVDWFLPWTNLTFGLTYIRCYDFLFVDKMYWFARFILQCVFILFTGDNDFQGYFCACNELLRMRYLIVFHSKFMITFHSWCRLSGARVVVTRHPVSLKNWCIFRL